MDKLSDDSQRTPRRAAGFPFLLCGVVFLCAGLATDRPVFLGVGPAFLAIGIALLAHARARAPRS